MADEDPELLLQIILYTRRALNIRTASNYILAVAALHDGSSRLIGMVTLSQERQASLKLAYLLQVKIQIIEFKRPISL